MVDMEEYLTLLTEIINLYYESTMTIIRNAG
jgi:hypothetical protein